MSNWFTERRKLNQSFEQAQFDIAKNNLFVWMQKVAEFWGPDVVPHASPLKYDTDYPFHTRHCNAAYKNAMRRGWRCQYVKEEINRLNKEKETMYTEC